MSVGGRGLDGCPARRSPVISYMENKHSSQNMLPFINSRIYITKHICKKIYIYACMGRMRWGLLVEVYIETTETGNDF